MFDAHTRTIRLPGSGQRSLRDRKGFTLVWCSLLMVAMVGMTGLVLDSGLLWAAHRQTQNAADAAALAVAWDLMKGVTSPNPTDRATTFVRTHNGLTSAPTPIVNIPPATGPYAGNSKFVEVLVSYPVQTGFIQVLGVNQNQSVAARAVAGFEPVTAGEGVAVLDPDQRPGLSVQGTGTTLRVNGRIIVNSEGGGEDEDGNPVNNGNNGTAAAYGGNLTSATGVFATSIDVVGGVDSRYNYKNFATGANDVLGCRCTPESDPLINLPTPTVANGVDITDRGIVRVSNTSWNPDPDPPQGSPANSRDPITGIVTLYPGIYQSIDISGGIVNFMPGIYVVKWKSQGNGTSFSVTGAPVITARGVMIYNTGHNYNSATGTPDINDGENKPPQTGGPEDGANMGGINIGANSIFSPIDTSLYSYSNPNISVFNGMLMYQRRKNRNGIDVTASGGSMSGTLYAKWAKFTITGQGTYGAQFIAGALKLDGGSTIILSYAGTNLGKANQIFLVE